MATYDALSVLPGGKPGPWSSPVTISYDKRDVLLYAVGIGLTDLSSIFEGHPNYRVFPTFPIRWGSRGVMMDEKFIPKSPLPLMVDAERHLTMQKPLPLEGRVFVKSRLIGIHPKGKGSAFVESESIVEDEEGEILVRMSNGSFRRGVEKLGDIEPFEGVGETFSTKVDLPVTPPDILVSVKISPNQAHIYRLSGDYNPLHIDPEAARFGGFKEPILHGLCTFGHCAGLLVSALCEGRVDSFKSIKLRFSAPVYPNDTLKLRVWRDGPGRALFEARVDDRVVVSNALFKFTQLAD